MDANDWALVGGILVFVLWVCLMEFFGVMRNVYTLGRTDQIQRKNHEVEYHGVAQWVYHQGRRKEALRYRLRVQAKRKQT